MKKIYRTILENHEFKKEKTNCSCVDAHYDDCEAEWLDDDEEDAEEDE